MYSLGVMLFAMIAGFFPLAEASPSDWRYEKMQEAQANNESTCRAIGRYSTDRPAPELLAGGHARGRPVADDRPRTPNDDGRATRTRGSPARPSLRHQPTDRWRGGASVPIAGSGPSVPIAGRDAAEGTTADARQSRGSSGASIWTTRRRGSSCSERDGCLAQGPY